MVFVCYGFKMKCPHSILKAWSPFGGTVLGGARNFGRMDLAQGSWRLGAFILCLFSFFALRGDLSRSQAPVADVLLPVSRVNKARGYRLKPLKLGDKGNISSLK